MLPRYLYKGNNSPTRASPTVATPIGGKSLFRGESIVLAHPMVHLDVSGVGRKCNRRVVLVEYHLLPRYREPSSAFTLPLLYDSI